MPTGAKGQTEISAPVHLVKAPLVGMRRKGFADMCNNDIVHVHHQIQYAVFVKEKQVKMRKSIENVKRVLFFLLQKE